MKKVICVVLAFLILYPLYGLSEQTMGELDSEFDQLMEEYSRIQQIRDTLKNGLNTYPNISENYDNILDVKTQLPDEIYTFFPGDEVVGAIYLVTGTVIDMPSYFEWIVDVDGKEIHIWPLCYIDGASVKKKALFPHVGEKANFYITYIFYDYPNAIFCLDVTNTEIEYAKSQM